MWKISLLMNGASNIVQRFSSVVLCVACKSYYPLADVVDWPFWKRRLSFLRSTAPRTLPKLRPPSPNFVNWDFVALKYYILLLRCLDQWLLAHLFALGKAIIFSIDLHSHLKWRELGDYNNHAEAQVLIDWSLLQEMELVSYTSSSRFAL